MMNLDTPMAVSLLKWFNIKTCQCVKNVVKSVA